MRKPRPSISELRGELSLAENLRDTALGRLRAVVDETAKAGVRYRITECEADLVHALVLERDALKARVAELELRLRLLSP